MLSGGLGCRGGAEEVEVSVVEVVVEQVLVEEEAGLRVAEDVTARTNGRGGNSTLLSSAAGGSGVASALTPLTSVVSGAAAAGGDALRAISISPRRFLPGYDVAFLVSAGLSPEAQYWLRLPSIKVLGDESFR